MAHILYHLDTEIKVIVDTHTTEHTLGQLRKEYKIEIAKYYIIGNCSRERGITIFTKKSRGYESSDLLMIDNTKKSTV